MGEVRVKAKLSNLNDEVLVKRGQLTPDKVRSYEADALVDTGAVRSVIPIHIVQQLGLTILDLQVAEYADGSKDVVGVTEAVNFRIIDRRTADEALVLGDEVLIGQTVLKKMDLLVDCANHRVIPNPAHPDQPVSKVK
ncbi:MAG: clan AA aspartic protease [Acidobacteria bacterium]|nr:clan AA aspartic protease [Acidobacteriota bacterium]